MGAKGSTCCGNTQVDASDELATSKDNESSLCLVVPEVPVSGPSNDEFASPHRAPNDDDADSPVKAASTISEMSKKSQQSSSIAEQQLEPPSPISPTSRKRIECAALLESIAELAKQKEWCEAELFIVRALDASDQQHDLWHSISDNADVREVLRISEILLRARATLAAPGVVPESGGKSKADKAAALGFPGWTMLPPVDPGVRTLFPDAPPDYAKDIDCSATMLWRLEGKLLTIKVLGEIPSVHPTLPKAFAIALTSMFSEVDLNEFVPIHTAKPQFLEEPRLDYLTWSEQSKIRFVMSEVVIQEMVRVTTPEGMCVLVDQKISDPEDERCKRVKVPSGYTLSLGDDQIYNVLILGDDRFGYISTVGLELPGAAPSWLLNMVLSWLFPSILNKMFTGAKTIFSHPEYVKRQEEDVTGYYARVMKAVEDGKRREQESGRKVRMRDHTDRPQQDHFSIGSLAQRVASLSTP